MALGVVAWGALARAVARSIESRLVGLIAVGLVLLLGLTPQIAVWDADMLSESIMVSLTVLLVAIGLELGRGPSLRTLATALTVGTLWVFARQENVLLYLPLLPVLIALAFWRLRLRAALIVSAVLLLVGGWASYSVLIGQSAPPANSVSVFNAGDLAVGRIVSNPAMRRYFQRDGMPVRLVTAAARLPQQDRAAASLVRNPRFRRWAATRFRGALASWLAGHPVQTLVAPFGSLLSAVALVPFDDGTPRAVLPTWVTGLVWTTDQRDTLTGLLLAAGLLGGCAALRRRPTHLAVLLILGAATCGATIVTFDLSTQDYARLFIPIGLALRLTLLLACALAADRLVASGGAPRGVTASVRPEDRQVVRSGA